jgi:hypothetical protein
MNPAIVAKSKARFMADPVTRKGYLTTQQSQRLDANITSLLTHVESKNGAPLSLAG